MAMLLTNWGRWVIAAAIACPTVPAIAEDAEEPRARDGKAVEQVFCAHREDSRFAFAYDELSWVPKNRQVFDVEKWPTRRPHPERPHALILAFGAKLSKDDIQCQATDLLKQVERQGKALIVELKGSDVVAILARNRRTLLVYHPKDLRRKAIALFNRERFGMVRGFIAAAREIGMTFDDIEQLDVVARLGSRRQAGLRALNDGDSAGAIERLEPVADRYPEDFEVQVGLARAYYQHSDYGRATALLEALRKRNPLNGEVLFQLGLVEMSRGREDLAVVRFTEAAHRGFENAHFYLGFAFFKHGSYPEARTALKYFLRHGTDVALQDRAVRMLEAADNDRARADVASNDAAAADEAVRPLQVAVQPSTAPRSEPSVPIAEPVAPEPAAAPERVSAYGHSIRLEGFRRPSQAFDHYRGNVVLLHLWASWCLPCLKEIPSLAAFHREDLPRLAANGLALVTVSMDYARGDLERFAERRAEEPAIDFPIYWDPNWKLAESLALGSALPQTIVVGSDGEVLTVAVGEQDWRSDAFLARIEAHLDAQASEPTHKQEKATRP